MAEDERDQNNTGKKKVLGDLVAVESMLQLALALPAGCLIGWLLGSWLDKHFHTEWIGIVGLGLGAAGGFVQMYRMASHYMRGKR